MILRIEINYLTEEFSLHHQDNEIKSQDKYINQDRLSFNLLTCTCHIQQ
jgi:hypothetical protein